MTSGDFAPEASWLRLHQRAALLKTVRDFFAEYGFLEVETPLLSRDTVIDRHLDPLAVTLFSDPRQPQVGETYWLQTSPEFGMKRLLAAGAPSIYQVTRAFRGGEQGARHNPEFTMLEWYGVGHTYEQGMNFLSQLAERLFQRGTAERLTYRQAFQRFANIDPYETSTIELAVRCKSLNLHSEDRELLIDAILTHFVEPNLGREQPTILYDYPAEQSALAQVRAEQPPVAERFELYVAGVELANGYHELTDPHILRNRNERNNQARADDGKTRLPETSRLLAAMEHGLPECTGCALGFDRAAMLATGAQSIQEVIAFPIDRA